MNETSKTLKIWGELEKSLLLGSGIDIGCGPDPITPTVKTFDIEDGDANNITQYVADQYDFVYSSHCLEHMQDPKKALLEWWKLVKVGGHLILIVPDEDLYEQGNFPSIFNEDHKNTFTLSKAESWSSASHNILDMSLALPNSQLLQIVLQDHGYDRRLLRHGIKRPSLLSRIVVSAYKRFSRMTTIKIQLLEIVKSHFKPVDQTLSSEAVAQIQCIIKKTA